MKILPLVCVVGCSSPTVTPLFAVPGESTGDDFYALPFPNDIRRSADGTIDLTGFPTKSLLVDHYVAAAEQLDGFGMNSPIFVRFSDDLDVTLFQDPAGTMADDAAIYLVDIDPDSPHRGDKTPLALSFTYEGTDTMGPHALVARPFPGFGLAEATTYALVVTNRTIDAYGEPVERGGDFGRVIGGQLATDAYAPLLAWLDEPGGDSRDNVVVATVFTTQHATSIMHAIRAGVYGTPAPVPTAIAKGMIASMNYNEYDGTYQAPNFQTGDVPYRDTGGNIEVMNDVAVVQRMEPMRFALTIPTKPMPPNGYPLTIYSHGTGGDYRSFIEDHTGEKLAIQGIATISTDQVLHGPRNPGGDAEIDFFNFNNPLAAQNNPLQGAADAFSQHRLALNITLPDLPNVKFDPTKIYFYGHSQGGATGPGFVAFEPEISGAVLSGTAGNLTLGLLAKTLPLNIPELLTSLVRDDPVDANNPTIALLQTWMERTDPINYAPFMVRNPQGVAPRNIFQTEGFTDHYSPNVGIEAFAVALGADIAANPDQKPIDGVTLHGGKSLPMPITNNAGAVTCVLGQYKQKPGSDGHFVVFDVGLASNQSTQFLATLAATGKATVVSP